MLLLLAPLIVHSDCVRQDNSVSLRQSQRSTLMRLERAEHAAARLPLRSLSLPPSGAQLGRSVMVLCGLLCACFGSALVRMFCTLLAAIANHGLTDWAAMDVRGVSKALVYVMECDIN